MNKTRTVVSFVLPFLAVALVLLAAGRLEQTAPLAAAPLAAAPLTTWHVAPGGDDANDCLSLPNACATISAAIDKASDDDTIVIAAGTYNEHDIEVSKRLTLTGAGAATTIIDGGRNGRVFALHRTVTLSHLTIQNGETPEDGNFFVASGAGLYVSAGESVLLQHVVVRDNYAPELGGGIFNMGQLTIDQSQILNNEAGGQGGGIYGNTATGAITITTSLLSENRAGHAGGGISTNHALLVSDSQLHENVSESYLGGGIAAFGADARLEGVTLSGNQALEGAAIFAQISGAVILENTTLSGNIAGNNYGGIYASGPGINVTIHNSTITGNSRTNSSGVGRNGIAIGGGAQATVSNSIIANNDELQCISNGLVSDGHNLSSDFSCDFTATGDLQGEEPLLFPLGDYGGATPVHALQAGSPAIDAAGNANCPATDQRGLARPYDGDGDSTATCDIGAVELQPQLTIEDLTVLEGTGGATTALFTVSLFPASDDTVTVEYETADGTATAPHDYAAASGVLTFDPHDTEKTISVSIVGDGDDEADETFTVNLSNAANATVAAGAATATIIDDDGLPRLSINDVTMLEGDSGTQQMLFTVTLSPSSAETVTVDYATVGHTATAPGDFMPLSGFLTFAPGETSKEVSVTIVGDVTDEGTEEEFAVQLSRPENAALEKDAGVGIITDDDTARLSHESGPQLLEGDSGVRPATFTVTLSTPAAFPITVDYTITSGCCDDGATAGEDFSGVLSDTLTFAPGETVVTYSVDIIGDLEIEPDERFTSRLDNASAPLAVNTAIAIILNDDDGTVDEQENWLYLPVIRRE